MTDMIKRVFVSQVADAQIVTLRDRTSPGRDSNFVEIEPVMFDGEVVIPIFGEEARASSKMEITGPGDFSLNANPNYVNGAYENLKHHQARDILVARNLECTPGVTHLIPVSKITHLSMSFNIETAGDFSVIDGQQNFAFSNALISALTAGNARGATHVAIKIS
jgi:hypothetical protein